jgi:hypothetical protein
VLQNQRRKRKMGAREQTKIEFQLIILFVRLVLNGLSLCIAHSGDKLQWNEQQTRFYKVLEKYEKDYI